MSIESLRKRTTDHMCGKDGLARHQYYQQVSSLLDLNSRVSFKDNVTNEDKESLKQLVREVDKSIFFVDALTAYNFLLGIKDSIQENYSIDPDMIAQANKAKTKRVESR